MLPEGGNSSGYSKAKRRTKRRVGSDAEKEALAEFDKQKQLLSVFMKAMEEGHNGQKKAKS